MPKFNAYRARYHHKEILGRAKTGIGIMMNLHTAILIAYSQ